MRYPSTPSMPSTPTPSGHFSVLKTTRLADIVPGANIGKGTKDALEAKIRLIWLEAVNRAESNGRVTVYPHDI